MRTLVWFRTDLRTHDNLALHHARAAVRDTASAREGDAPGGMVALFVISPGEWRDHDYAPAKVDLMLRTLGELSRDLAALNIPLLIARAASIADVPALVAKAAADNACGAVFFNREYEVNEAARDARTMRECASLGIKCYGYHDQVYAPPGEVRTAGGSGGYFTVYTPFKKASYARMLKEGIPGCVPVPKPLSAMVRAPDPVPTSVEGFESRVPASRWPAGEAHARTRLATFARERIVPYKAERDFPGKPGTSELSPYLAIGAISCRQCLSAAVDANREFMGARAASQSPLDSGSEGIAHWISELLWREFYIHIMVGFPRVCKNRAFQPSTEAVRWNDNPIHFEAWTQGRTGVPIVDAGMRQLLRDGWVHNRVRMVVAMYLTKNLFLDWRLGESWFMRNLVDGFLASNNGGWQWSASTGTDAAPYFRIFNPVSQSEKFDPKGEYIREFVPELSQLEGDAIHQPWTLPSLLRSRLEYPQPLVDLSVTRERAIAAFQAIKKA
jgi:deoxyribodipyrimidine photo-lyase